MKDMKTLNDFLESLSDTKPLPKVVQRGPWKSYQPSNGSEGRYFEAEFCDRCKHENAAKEDWCEIHNNALFYKRSDEGYPAEYWVYFNGKPTCLAFKDRDDDESESKPQPVVSPGQLDMFLELPVVAA